jgi:hypothetical protein
MPVDKLSDLRPMKEFFLMISSVLAIAGLVILQLKILKHHHPNAVLLIGLLKMLDTDQLHPGDHSNG